MAKSAKKTASAKETAQRVDDFESMADLLSKDYQIRREALKVVDSIKTFHAKRGKRGITNEEAVRELKEILKANA